MDKEEKKNNEKRFQECEFPFPFRTCEKMAELMKRYCAGEGLMADCCSMMMKMMGDGKKKEGDESGGRP